jgi:DNA-directed RNA polymerase specialized sigma subunit
VENIELLSTLFVNLTDRERKVLLLRYYLGWTQSEIGADLGFSQMQISRTLRSAMNKLAMSHHGGEALPWRSEEPEESVSRADQIA